MTCSECGLTFARLQVVQWRRGCQRIVVGHAVVLGAVILVMLVAWNVVGDGLFITMLLQRWYVGFGVFALLTVGAAMWGVRHVRRRTLDVRCPGVLVICAMTAVAFTALACAMAWLRSTAAC